MGTKLKTILPLLLLAAVSLSTLCTISQAKEDPQLQECRRQCSQRPRQQRQKCEQQCWEQHEQRGQGREGEREWDADNPRGDAEKHLEQCRRQCEETQYGGHQRKQCEQQCLQRYEQERESGQGQERERGREQEKERGQDREIDPQERIHQRNPRRSEVEEKGGEEREERGGENPYVFKREHFKHKLRTEHGNIRVLTNFAKRSKLLLGIANYRVVLVELNPRTFLLPNHWDADDICYVVKGIFFIFLRYLIQSDMYMYIFLFFFII